MGAILDHPDITNAQLHRRELRRVAARTARRPHVTAESVPATTGLPVLAERRELLASLTQMWDGAELREVEHADPLGVWSYGQPVKPLITFDSRVALDWGVWAVLLVLSGYLATGR